MTDAIFAHPARVLYQQTPEDAARWLEIVTGRRASDATVFENRPPFFWPAEISNQRLDSYFTKMGVSTLRNFAQAANDGVAFQNSHRWMELPLGQSVEGLFVEDADTARTLAVFYTLPDLNVNNVNTSQFIDGLRAGIIQDVSVGFYGGQFICSICGRDMWRDMECRHWPGFTYDVKDGETTRQVLATATVENGLLSEVSAVYDGATPGAGVLKAQRELDAGRLDRRQVDLLEQRYRVRLVGPRTFGGVTLADETDVTQTETREAPPAVPADLPAGEIAVARWRCAARPTMRRQSMARGRSCGAWAPAGTACWRTWSGPPRRCRSCGCWRRMVCSTGRPWWMRRWRRACGRWGHSSTWTCTAASW